MRTSYARPSTPGNALWQWFLWVAFSAAGLAAGYALLRVTMPLIRIAPGSISTTLFFARIVTFGLLEAIPYGLAQWLYLRSIRSLWPWSIATALTYPLIEVAVMGVGLGVGNIIDTQRGKALLEVISELAPYLFIPSFIYVPIGVAQWLVLRRHFRKSAVWIPTSYLAWVITIFVLNLVAILLLRFSNDSLQISSVAWVAMRGGLQAAMTGPILLLLKPRAPTAQGVPEDAPPAGTQDRS